MDPIPISGPDITQREIAYVTDAVTRAWYQNANIYNDRFEKTFAAYVGMRHAVSLPSCTSAIHLSLAALGIGPGDEVIVPDITWIASAAPVTYVGATPVFADINPLTWCISTNAFESCISPKTRAVIPVDLYGNISDMDAIREVAKAHDIAIIEDAAEAIGSEFHGRKAGSLGDMGVFSFHGSKILTTGEGGMLVTDSEPIFRRVLSLRDHGREPNDTMFFNAEIGFKYKMSSMQAALGLAQLERIGDLVDRKRWIFRVYREELERTDGITLNYEAPGTKNTYWMVTVVLDPAFRILKEELISRLKSNNIDSRPFFYPLSSIPAYARHEQAGIAREKNVVSYQISPYGVNLPSGLNLTEEQIVYVCDCLKHHLNN